jgi:4-oxalocrotonate tautomerase
MPLIQVHYATARAASPSLKPAIARTVADASAALLGKRLDLTAVIVTAVDPADWFVAGTALSASGVGSYAVEIKVTEGTNTRGEKSAFIARLHEALAALLGPVHPESYIHVEEARGDAYGYGGFTQEFRAVSAAIEAMERDRLRVAAVTRHGVR